MFAKTWTKRARCSADESTQWSRTKVKNNINIISQPYYICCYYTHHLPVQYRSESRSEKTYHSWRYAHIGDSIWPVRSIIILRWPATVSPTKGRKKKHLPTKFFCSENCFYFFPQAPPLPVPQCRRHSRIYF